MERRRARKKNLSSSEYAHSKLICGGMVLQIGGRGAAIEFEG